jgi:hypothetical protein
MISVTRSSPARATDHIMLFPTPSGRPLKTDHARLAGVTLDVARNVNCDEPKV